MMNHLLSPAKLLAKTIAAVATATFCGINTGHGHQRRNRCTGRSGATVARAWAPVAWASRLVWLPLLSELVRSAFRHLVWLLKVGEYAGPVLDPAMPERPPPTIG